TSGTTGRAKGVVWTQDNYQWAGRVGARHLQLRAEDRILLYVPLFHANAQSYVLMPALWVGATIIVMPRFSASRFWPVSVEERATVASMIPFAVKALRAHDVPADHVYRCWGNGVIVPGWDKRFSVSTVSWWGMTETVSQPIVSTPGEAGHPLAMGRCAPEYEVRIVADDGTVLTPPAVGLLQVLGERGLSLFAEYLDDPQATASTFTADGWLETGDRVEAHDDGWFSFVERDKDMLKVGAENVAALEIERVVNTVTGVRAVAVVAAPDPMLEEIPVAFVVPTDDAPADLGDQIVQHCRSQLADFKVPRLVSIVDALPESLLGKIAKNVLRKR
ncbi:MAG TPA: AMP-binding protein, partial [Ilumatobacteraceae bacterium]|nr:AMP-binding protein [Ilumatobacteraceae bacterium]